MDPFSTRTPFPDRVPWGSFPDIVIHSPVPKVKNHPDYWAAKSGDPEAAARLVKSTISSAACEAIREIALPTRPILASVHAIEEFGTNAIPEAFAGAISERCNGLDVDELIVQTNIVGHTGASGFDRLARQALFDGAVQSGRAYILVDDFVGQGGTIANLRGYIAHRGGNVVLAVTLTGKPHSAKLVPDSDRIGELRRKYGPDLENWWKEEFGFEFGLLTASEARYLESTADADTIRNRILEAKQKGDLHTGKGGVE